MQQRSGHLMTLWMIVGALSACGSSDKSMPPEPVLPRHVADVIGVVVSGDPGAYRFDVTLASPDSGCARYADWWEVLSEDGELLYRRVLLHSHTAEQPFTRSGTPVVVAASQPVWVRAHMHPGGYGGRAMWGTPTDSLVQRDLALDFAAHVAQEEPLPTGCAF